MLKRAGLLCLLVFPLTSGCAEQGGAPSLSEPATNMGELVPVSLDVLPPGVYPQKIEREDGRLLRYTISIPSGYSPQRAVPLVLALHFGAGRRGQPIPEFFGRSILEILVEPALQELGAIVVAPDSVAGRWTNSENEQAVLQILDRVFSTYRVDRSKVLVTGFSMGGSGTWYMAGRHPELFSAAIPIAARPPREEYDWQIPLYVIHSRADTVVPFDRTEAFVKELQAQSVDVQFTALDGITHFQSPRFVQPLREAIPWIKQVWQRQESKTAAAEAD